MGRIYTATRMPAAGGVGVFAGVPGVTRQHDSVSSPITIATGVSIWGDLSGNANHFLQATGSKQPTVALNAINTTLQALLFDGVDDAMQATANTGTPWTRMTVAKWVGAAGTVVDHAGNQGRIFRGGAALTSYHDGVSQVDDAASTPAAWHLYTFVMSGPLSLCRVDSVSKGTFASSSAVVNKAAVGAFGDLVSDPFNGYVAADVEWGRVLSATEMSTAEALLRAKWGTP